MRTSDGKSRQFGFVGFRTEQEADDAIKYFNRSFMDTSQITCEVDIEFIQVLLGSGIVLLVNLEDL